MNRVEVSSSVDFLQPTVETLSLTQVKRFRFYIPFSVCASMVLVALGALCVSVGLRTHSQLQQAVHEQQALKQELAMRQLSNQKLAREIDGLQKDSRLIEQAAREMGMVKKNELIIVLPKTSK